MNITLTPMMVVVILGGIFFVGLIAGVAIESRLKRKKNDDGARNSSLRIIVERRGAGLSADLSVKVLTTAEASAEAGILTLEIIPAVVTPPHKGARAVIKTAIVAISILINVLFILWIMAALLSSSSSNSPQNEFQYKNFIPITAHHL